MNNKLFTILFLVGFILFPTALAANSQGLVWGVEEGQEIQYTMHIRISYTTTFTTTTLDETDQLLYTVGQLPLISTVVDGAGDLPYSVGTMTYANGSAISNLSVAIPVSNLIMPIGNWALIDEIYKEAVGSTEANVTWINDLSSWGYRVSMQYSYPYTEMSATLRYSKADGVLSYLSVTYDYGEMGSTEATLTRIGGPLDATTLILVAGGIGVVLIIGVAFWKLRS